MKTVRSYGYLYPADEDVTRCVEEVSPEGLAGIGSSHQCYRKRGHGPNGEFCKQHAKINAKLREERGK